MQNELGFRKELEGCNYTEEQILVLIKEQDETEDSIAQERFRVEEERVSKLTPEEIQIEEDETIDRHVTGNWGQAYRQQSSITTEKKEYAIDPNKKKEYAVDTLLKGEKANASRNINEVKCARDLYKTEDTLKSKMESLQKSTRECAPKQKLQSSTANNKNEVRYASDYNKKNENLK